MARTQLLGWINGRMAAAQAQLGVGGPRALTRRSALLMLAATAACTPQAGPELNGEKGQVAVIGGGVSGLVAAWRLAISGASVELFEASGRLGGRMHTLRDFTPAGQFCELGGEFVDSDDEALLRVCGELGVRVEPMAPEGAGPALYDIGGFQWGDADLLDPAGPTGPFLAVALRVAADQAALLDGGGKWTERARQLDDLPLSDYLASLAPSTEPWVIALLKLAWQAEAGLPVEQQSSLNFVDLIGTDTTKPFAMFGKRDGALRIAGGSSSLPEALERRLTSEPLVQRVVIHKRHALAAIARKEDGLRLSFRAENGAPLEKTFAHVVMALPFTRLREIRGLGGLALPADKMMVINELGYGAAAKLIVGAQARPANSRIISDRGFQMVWDSSIGQGGEGAVLTNYFAGEAAKGEETQALAKLEAGLAALSPELARTLTPKVRTSFFWANHPHTRGSYASCLVGQYTRYPEIAARLELDGRLAFAGEHTSMAALGTMTGAVEAGERAARELLASS
jgi:monoamine oxidase